jgi:hypothetical protein
MKKIIVFLLSVIGISATSCITAMYGTPEAEFELKGKVTDTLNNPIENIQIDIQLNDNYADRTSSNAKGNYELINHFSPHDNASITIKVEDIDGEENGGEFATQIISIPIKDSDYVKDKRKKDFWYNGKVSKEINFKLIKKQ